MSTINILSQTVARIKPSPTLAVTAKANELKQQGKKVIALGVGEPDFNTPEHIKNAAIDAIHDNQTRYTAVDGTVELKEAIINKFKRENNLSYEKNQITVGTGAKQVLFNALIATLNEGDEVIIPAPYWVSYPDMVAFANGKSVIIDCAVEDNFLLNAKQLRESITDKTKWLILNSPSNPTGYAYSAERLKELAQVLLEHPHVNIISDDIYEHIIFDGFKFATIADIEPKLFNRVLTVNGVSKAYSMTGWRIGYAGCGNKDLIKAISKIQSQSTSNPCSISQAASVVALNGPQGFLAERAKIFQERRDFLVKEINNIEGLTCNKPDGAFYLFASCEGNIGKTTNKGAVINNSIDFANYLLEEALLAVVPGSAFGIENYFRISYATSMEILKDACARINSACQKLK